MSQNTHFDQILHLMDAIANTEDDPGEAKYLIGFCKDRVLNMSRYVQSIVNASILIPTYRYLKEGDDLISSIEGLDSERRSCHNTAVASVAQLNRLSRAYLGAPIFEIDESKFHLDKRGDYCREFRAPVADWCIELVDDAFYRGQNRSLSEMRDIENQQEAFSQKINEEYDIDGR